MTGAAPRSCASRSSSACSAWLLVTTFQSATADTDDGLSRAGHVLALRRVHAHAVPRQRGLLRRRVLHGRPGLRLGARARGAAPAHPRARARARGDRRAGRRARPRADRPRAARRRRPPRLGDGRAGGRRPRGAWNGIRMPRARRCAAIETEARSALDELHHLLETLRTPGRRRPERVDGAPLGPRRTRRARPRERDADDPHDRRRAGGAARPRAGQRLPRRAGGAHQRAAAWGSGCRSRRPAALRAGRPRARDRERGQARRRSCGPGSASWACASAPPRPAARSRSARASRGGFLVRMRVPLASRVTA